MNLLDNVRSTIPTGTKILYLVVDLITPTQFEVNINKLYCKLLKNKLYFLAFFFLLIFYWIKTFKFLTHELVQINYMIYSVILVMSFLKSS